MGLPWRLSSKESAWNARDLGSTPGSGSSPGGGHGYPLQYPCLENPTDRGAWRAAVHGVAQRRTWLSDSAAAAATTHKILPVPLKTGSLEFNTGLEHLPHLTRSFEEQARNHSWVFSNYSKHLFWVNPPPSPINPGAFPVADMWLNKRTFCLDTHTVCMNSVTKGAFHHKKVSW